MRLTNKSISQMGAAPASGSSYQGFSSSMTRKIDPTEVNYKEVVDLAKIGRGRK